MCELAERRRYDHLRTSGLLHMPCGRARWISRLSDTETLTVHVE